jgi:hypothetical protein
VALTEVAAGIAWSDSLVLTWGVPVGVVVVVMAMEVVVTKERSSDSAPAASSSSGMTREMLASASSTSLGFLGPLSRLGRGGPGVAGAQHTSMEQSMLASMQGSRHSWIRESSELVACQHTTHC